MFQDNVKYKEQKVFVIMFCIFVFIGIVLALTVERRAIFKIINWSINFQEDYWMTVDYATNIYTLDTQHGYPPFLNFLYVISGKIGDSINIEWVKRVIVFICNFLPIFVTYKIIRKYFKNFKPLFALLLSLPGAYFTCFRSGNSAYIIIIFSLIFILYYNSEDRIEREISILSLAIAISTRIIPALFGFLLILNKRYKDIIKLGIYCIVLFFIPLIFIVKEVTYIEKIKLFFGSLITYSDSSLYNKFGEFKAVYYVLFNILHIDIKLFDINICIKILLKVLSLLMLIICTYSNSYFKKVLSLCFIFMLNASTTYHSYIIFAIPLIIYFNEKETHINLIILIIYIIAVFAPVSYFFIEHTEFIVGLHSLIMDSLFDILLFYLIFDFFKEIYIKSKKGKINA